MQKEKKKKKKTSQFNFYRNEVFKEAVKTKLTHHILHLRKYFLFYPIRAGIKKKLKMTLEPMMTEKTGSNSAQT